MATVEELEEEDFSDFLRSKSTVLDAYKREYTEVEKEIENSTSRIVTRDRESVALLSELNGVRDQVSFTRRNIDELLAAQESIKLAIEVMSSRKTAFIDRERSNKDEITTYSNLFEDLKVALAVGSDWTPEQLELKQTLEKERDFLISKLENKSSQVSGVRGDVDRLFQSVKEFEDRILAMDNESNELDNKYKDIQNQSRDQIKRKDEEEKKIFELRGLIVKTENLLLEKQRQLKNEERSQQELDNTLRTTKQRMEDSIKEYDDLYRVLTEFSGDFERQKNQNKKLEEEIIEREVAIAEKTKEMEYFTKESNKTAQLREAVTKKCAEMDSDRMSAEMKRDTLNKQINQLVNVEIITVRKLIDSQDKQIAVLKQELEIVRKRQSGSEKASKTIQDLLQSNLNGKKNLVVEQRFLEEEVCHQKDAIRILLAEKERFEQDIELSNQQYYTALEELKLQELQVQELQRKIQEDQGKLKHKQNLYEAVRSDRNLYSKQLVESQEEIQTLRRKFRNMNHQIDQLKDEISSKDHAIVKEHFLHHSVDKERELLKNELTKIRKQLQSSDAIIENQRVEILKLNRIIEEAEQERTRQRNELSSVLAERNLLTSQVIKRNFELTTIYDKIKVQRSNLKIGERQYNKVLTAILQMKQKLHELVHSNNDTINGLVGLEELRTKVIQLDKEILTERSKSRALMDELEKPMNVHRWRVLESSDPKRFEKISQIQSLQKQLISKSDEVVKLDLLVQEKEKVYVELKNIIARQPGPEVEEQLLVYQQTHKEKIKQLTAMEDELSMYRQQVASFKEDMDIIDSQMNSLKKKYFKVKKTGNKFAK